MYCPKCGGQIPFGKQYCPKCKAPLFGDATPQTRTEVISGSKTASFWDKMILNSIKTSAIRKSSRKTYNIIWIAMFTSLPIYVVVMFLLCMNKEIGGNASPIIFSILCAVALICFAFGHFNLNIQLVEEKILKQESKDGASMYVQTVGIISMALFESLAIYGLVLCILGFSKIFAYLFFTLSALMLINSRAYTDSAWNLIEMHPKFSDEKSE